MGTLQASKENSTSKQYNELLKEEGLKVRKFAIHHRPKTASNYGLRRKTIKNYSGGILYIYKYHS